jgi:hypothetical protein
MGPSDAVLKEVEPFVRLVKSIQFEAGAEAKPEWQTPKGWEQQAGSGMRYATLLVPSDGKPLELSVIPLPTDEADSDAALLANVNRWRGQLQLKPITAEELPKETVQVELSDGTLATIVNILGKSGGKPMGMAPFAGGAGRPSDALEARRGERGGERAPGAGEAQALSYVTPDGWKPGKVGGLRKAAFAITAGGEKAEVTAIDLASGAGAVLPNVNRWRQQVELKEITESDLQQDLKKIEIDGVEADYVELAGPKQTILGVIFPRGDKVWFFKLQGDSALAQREKSHFETFVQSVKFRGTRGADNGQ